MCSIKKNFPRNFANILEKHLCQSLFLIKVSTFMPINSIIKQYCSCCITLIRTDTILSKNIQNNFQNLLFKKLLAQSGDQTDILQKFYSPADTLWSPKTVECVLGYTTVSYAKHMLYPEQPTVLLARRHLSTMLFPNFETLNSIMNIFLETHNFLVLTWVLLNRAPTSIHLHPAHFNLHPAPSTSTQLISASTQLSASPSTIFEPKYCM